MAAPYEPPNESCVYSMQKKYYNVDDDFIWTTYDTCTRCGLWNHAKMYKNKDGLWRSETFFESEFFKRENPTEEFAIEPKTNKMYRIYKYYDYLVIFR